jgi:hypothetical protein
LEQLDFNYHNVKQKETAGQKDINKTVSKTKIKHKYNTETSKSMEQLSKQKSEKPSLLRTRGELRCS